MHVTGFDFVYVANHLLCADALLKTVAASLGDRLVTVSCMELMMMMTLGTAAATKILTGPEIFELSVYKDLFLFALEMKKRKIMLPSLLELWLYFIFQKAFVGMLEFIKAQLNGCL